MAWQVEEIPFLREIYRPDQEPEIDICFVHGLNPWSKLNHAFDTWTHENGKFWPFDFLREDIPEARIFVYGYNSNVAKEVSEARIKDHANVLLDRLQRKRKVRRQHGTTPIIFVGHSLGGLVIKQALLNARDDMTYEPIKSFTYGLVFFGTPHRGGKNAMFGNIAAKVARYVSGDRASNDLIECLQTNSLFTREASERFSHQLENYKIISFFETVPMKLGVKGVSDIVVDQDSAVLNLPGSRERREALNADHSSMCKISKRGDMYEGVVGKLQDMVDEALDWVKLKAAAPGNASNGFLSPDVPSAFSPRGMSPAPSFDQSISRSQSPIPTQLQPAPSTDNLRGRAASDARAPPPPPPPPVEPRRQQSKPSITAKALYDFTPEQESDLPFSADEIIYDINKETKDGDEWWEGTNSKGQTGLFPRNYVELVQRALPPAESQSNVNKNPYAQFVASDQAKPQATPVLAVTREETPAAQSNSLSGVFHMGILCNICKKEIYGIRYKCLDCLDWDCCQICIKVARQAHLPNHEFNPIFDPSEFNDEEFVKSKEAAQREVQQRAEEEELQKQLERQMEALGQAYAEKYLQENEQAEALGRAFVQKYLEESQKANAGMEMLLKNLDEACRDLQLSATSEPRTDGGVNHPELDDEIPPPIPAVIPACYHCKVPPQSYPVFNCETCVGKTVICMGCNDFLRKSGNNQHATHKVKCVTADYWFSYRHIVHDRDLTTGQPDEFAIGGWGLKVDIQTQPQYNLGLNYLNNLELLLFGPRPNGDFRFSLINVPAGEWEIRLQLSVGQSAFFTDKQVKALSFTKRQTVKANLTSIGFIDAYVAKVNSGVDWIMGREIVANDAWAQNCARYTVFHGSTTGTKLSISNSLHLSEGQDVAFYINYCVNAESFTKEAPAVQQALSFLWRLEGVRFIRKS